MHHKIRFIVLAAATAFASCSGSHSRVLPSEKTVAAPRAALAVATGAAAPSYVVATPGDAVTGLPGDSVTGLPGDAVTGLPGDAVTGLPGDAVTGLPGDAVTGLPGATFACSPTTQAGQARCMALVNTSVAPTASANDARAISGLHPADLQNRYGIPSANRGATVAVVDAFDDPTAEADLNVYRSSFGLPACTTANGCFKKINQRGLAGSYPQPDAGWSTEAALDLDMVSAACPKCTIVLVEADSALMDDLGASVDLAASLGVRAISNSYYAAEWSGEVTEDAHYRHAGVFIAASSGDTGRPSFPAASQYVTSVGGTSLTGSPGSWSETAWPYSGNGCSAFVPRPWYQYATGCGSRSTVDVAAVADPRTGVSIFSSAAGGWVVAGGTSVGSPLVAAAFALSANPTSPAWPYYHPSAFFHIGTHAYNYPVGLGAPNGVAGI